MMVAFRFENPAGLSIVTLTLSLAKKEEISSALSCAPAPLQMIKEKIIKKTFTIQNFRVSYSIS